MGSIPSAATKENIMFKKLLKLIRTLFGFRDETGGKPEGKSSLPTNPDIGPDKPNSISEHFTLSRKSYDNTYRIRWPSFFATGVGIGAGSYCMVGEHKARFRSYDTDNESKRPSYTLPLDIELKPPFMCVLHDERGKAIAWYDVTIIPEKGRLPQG